MARRRDNLFARIAPIAISLALLVAISWERAALRMPQGDPEPYHRAVRAAAAEMPYYVGEWIGADQDVPPSAITMLRPNAIVCRSYQNIRTGRSVTLLLVQCGDARDLLGHYPPVCYPAHGWTLTGSWPHDWTLGERTVEGTAYTFTRGVLSEYDAITIYNFMVTPDGRTARDMEHVSRAAQDYRRKGYGAAQVQMVFPGNVSEQERDAIFATLLGANLNLIQTIEAP